MFVKPKDGVKVRDEAPPYAHLPNDGAEVPDNSFWNRRLADGDVVLIAQPSALSTDKPAPKSKGGAQ